MEGASILQISPSELCFVYATNCELQNVLNLRNMLEDGRCVAFKVKSNNHNRYLVRPTSGIVRPGASVNVKVFMLPQAEYSDDLRSCKDRFLIQCAPIDGSTEGPKAPDMSGNKERQDIKISVNVVRGSMLVHAATPTSNTRLLVRTQKGPPSIHCVLSVCLLIRFPQRLWMEVDFPVKFLLRCRLPHWRSGAS